MAQGPTGNRFKTLKAFAITATVILCVGAILLADTRCFASNGLLGSCIRMTTMAT